MNSWGSLLVTRTPLMWKGLGSNSNCSDGYTPLVNFNESEILVWCFPNAWLVGGPELCALREESEEAKLSSILLSDGVQLLTFQLSFSYSTVVKDYFCPHGNCAFDEKSVFHATKFHFWAITCARLSVAFAKNWSPGRVWRKVPVRTEPIMWIKTVR